jgi:hypothetical protein
LLFYSDMAAWSGAKRPPPPPPPEVKGEGDLAYAALKRRRELDTQMIKDAYNTKCLMASERLERAARHAHTKFKTKEQCEEFRQQILSLVQLDDALAAARNVAGSAAVATAMAHLMHALSYIEEEADDGIAAPPPHIAAEVTTPPVVAHRAAAAAAANDDDD